MQALAAGMPGLFTLAAPHDPADSDVLQYSRHEFNAYFLQHAERQPHAVSADDPNWHLDGTPCSVDVSKLSTVTIADPSPEKFALDVVGPGPVRIGRGSFFSGVVYAPQAALAIEDGGNFYGAFVGDTVAVRGLSFVHYDQALRGSAGGPLTERTLFSAAVAVPDRHADAEANRRASTEADRHASAEADTNADDAVREMRPCEASDALIRRVEELRGHS